MTPEDLLSTWIASRLAPDALQWITRTADSLRKDARDADIYLAFSLVPRKTGKRDLDLTEAELAAAKAARPGWSPRALSVDQATRLYLLLASRATGDVFERYLTQLFSTADVAELVVLYCGLPLYPDPERHRLRAAEGIRSNMKAVFDAVAHDNPYVSEQLPTSAWNQLVLKALFMGSALHPIIGLDRRANPLLAQMLCDYAHERWSAGRPVSHELWRCVGPFATGPTIDDLKRVLENGTEIERRAAALALGQSLDPAADALFRTHPTIASSVTSGTLTWNTLTTAAQ